MEKIPQQYEILTYYGEILEQIPLILRENQIQVAFRSAISLGNMVYNKKWIQWKNRAFAKLHVKNVWQYTSDRLGCLSRFAKENI